MRIRTITAWYLRNERWISSLSLVGGFIFDIFALKRIDLFWENLWVGAHLGVAALGILLINLHENKKHKLSPKFSRIIHFWLIITIQFAFGGLLSTFLVFYFRSGTLSASWPFLLFLAIVFVLNELLKHHYTRLIFQTSVLYISIYSFAIFIVPVIVHQFGAAIFILSGLFSLAALGFFLFLLQFVARERYKQSRWPLFGTIAGITLLINVLYFTNLIPPIPLSLKDAGVYHSIVHTADGNYEVTGEQKSFWSFFQPYETFHEISGQPVYVFSSIFSPNGLSTQVIHEWQHYDETTKKWVIMNQTELSIVGGREGGFRTYSIKIVNIPGLWRVEVKTPQGQHIGRIKFNIVNVGVTPDLVTTNL
ncbi:TPA: hypothetical protein DCQ44_03265 [Candidatus Taylorbacteria bacterium]|nr:hypothetical protein [Candidatus Taylorbacteria bacterium]